MSKKWFTTIAHTITFSNVFKSQKKILRLILVISCTLVIFFFWTQLEHLSVHKETYVTKLLQALQTSNEKDLPYLRINQENQKIKQNQLSTIQEKYKTKQEHVVKTQLQIMKNQEQKKQLEYQKIVKKQKLKINSILKSPNTYLKYILFWSMYNRDPSHLFKEGQTSFIENNCSWVNCYATANKTLLKGDIKKFDAIAFYGPGFSRPYPDRGLPTDRSPHQKYIFFNSESADNYPVCNEKFDNFFNWTFTYKLNSDIPYPYIIIRNKKGDIIGPQTNMRWSQNMSEEDSSFSTRLGNKTKAAAWFVSHCSARSGRDKFVKKLQKALERYQLSVDVYGRCGTLNCPREEEERCFALLEKDYFFYMSLENSFAEDYVTEKLLIALQYNTVPIVIGEIDYNRFLPPGSYIDAKKYNVEELATYMDELMKSPHKYSQYFRWKSQYRYSKPMKTEIVCTVCAAMNEKIETVTVYDKFRKWWHPEYEHRCNENR